MSALAIDTTTWFSDVLYVESSILRILNISNSNTEAQATEEYVDRNEFARMCRVVERGREGGRGELIGCWGSVSINMSFAVKLCCITGRITNGPTGHEMQYKAVIHGREPAYPDRHLTYVCDD